MRLIDADSIKFTEYINGDITVSKDKIQNMPTIYDVGKVVELLKENEEDLIKSIKESSPIGYYMVSVDELLKLFKEYTEEQIKIVISGSQKGGVK